MMSAFLLTGCEIEDDGPATEHVLAEVVDTDLPEFFELGKVYEIEITYLLPDACHSAAGLQAIRGGFDQEKRRDIYVAGVAVHPAGQTECNRQEDDLERVNSFLLRVDDDEPFTFYLWKGVDANDENIYTEVVVPVGEPAPSTTE